jgi:Flp pilus assembly protein TadD
MKQRSIFLAFLLLATCLAAKTLVLPLAVDAQNHPSHQWLGKAVSYFLIAGLGHNVLAVSEEEEVQALLNRNLVHFPFAITKATAMILADESGAEQLLWGRILYSDKRSAPLQIQLFLIDIKEPRQRPLPLVKGNFADMFKLQEELLRHVVGTLAPGRREVIMPQLDMGLPEYEKFIKSLLLVDAGKKLELLLPAAGAVSRSSFVHFELAKACLEKRDPAACRSHLERVADTPFFKDRKDFLLALADQTAGDADAALNHFIRLQQRNVFPVPTHNNLGAIYLARGDFSLAEKCLRYALYLRRDPVILANLVLLLQAMGRNGPAQQELTGALRRFPEDEGLRKLFAAAVNAAENRESLGQAFRDFVALPLPGESVPALEARFMDPFGNGAPATAEAPANLAYIEARNLFLENDLEAAMQKAEEALENNPFEPENHHLLALLFLQKQQVVQADLYAQGALFLAETLDYYLLQLKIQQAGMDREKFRKTLALALLKFPDNPELLKLGGRGR